MPEPFKILRNDHGETALGVCTVMCDDLIELEAIAFHHPIEEHPEVPDTIQRLKENLQLMIHFWMEDPI